MTQISKINGITLVNSEITGFTYDDVDTFTITDNNSGSFSASMSNISVDSATITQFTASNLLTTDILSTTGDITTLTSSAALITDLNSTTGDITTFTASAALVTDLNATAGDITTLTSSAALVTDLNVTTGDITTLTSSAALVTDLNVTTGIITEFTSSAINLDGRLTFDDPLKYIEGDVGATMVYNGGGNSSIFRHTSNGWGRAIPGNFGFQDSTFPAIDSSAIVTITSTTKGLLIPRMTSTQRNAITAVAGLMIYNTTTSKHEGYDGAAWNAFY